MARLFSLILLLLTGTSTYASVESKKKLTICTELTKHTDTTQTATGRFQEQIAIASHKAGIDFTLQRKAWQRCIQDVKSGKVDALYALFWTLERDKNLIFPPGSHNNSNEWRLSTSRFYFYQNIQRPLNLEQLDFGIGIPLGYILRDKLKEMGALSPIDYDVREGFKMVARKRLDAYLVSERVGDAMLKSLNLASSLNKQQPAFFQQDLHIAFSIKAYSQNREVIHQFWNNLTNHGNN